MFAKVFSQIFDSSIAMDHVVRHVFMDLLVLADRDGVVDMTQDAIARRTNVPLEIIESALEKLSSPDEASRSEHEQGRRIMLIDSHRAWGWQIVNYHHYRNLVDDESRRAYFRDRKREQRGRERGVKTVLDSPHLSRVVTQAEAEADVEAKAKPHPGDAAVWSRVLCEKTGVHDMRDQRGMHLLLEAVGRQTGASLEDCTERLSSRWAEYQRATPGLEWAFGSAYKFFMSGNWDKPDTWRKQRNGRESENARRLRQAVEGSDSGEADPVSRPAERTRS